MNSKDNKQENILEVNLENCYGIKKLKHEFSFKNSQNEEAKINIIYAKNGLMKTSLAKTFLDLQNAKKSNDLIYEDRINKRTIKFEAEDLSQENIFVIESNITNHESKNISNLLVNQDLKREYEEVLSSLQSQKENFFKKLNKKSGIKKKQK